MTRETISPCKIKHWCNKKLYKTVCAVLCGPISSSFSRGIEIKLGPNEK